MGYTVEGMGGAMCSLGTASLRWELHSQTDLGFMTSNLFVRSMEIVKTPPFPFTA